MARGICTSRMGPPLAAGRCLASHGLRSICAGLPGLLRKKLFYIAAFGGLLAALPAPVQGAEGQGLCVTVQTEVELALDRSDPDSPVFSGTGDIYLTAEDALSHKVVEATVAEGLAMETPAGEKSAPDGTQVVYEGSMNARNGYGNYQALNGLDGKTESDMYIGKIRVSIPFTADFLYYGAGPYSLSIPVTLQAVTAYGSYDSGLDFTPWETLLSDGDISVSGTRLERVSSRGMVLDIDPSVTAISPSFLPPSYTEAVVPPSVASGYKAFQGSAVEKLVFGEGAETVPDGLCYGAKLLSEVVLPDTAMAFQGFCFFGCTSLKTVNFPQKMTLGPSCFGGCRGLEEFHATDGVKVSAPSAAYGPFAGSGLKKVIVEDGTTVVPDYLCAGCREVTELRLPDTLETAGVRSFTGMEALKEVVVRSSLERANPYSAAPCFEDTGLERIIFADGVTSVPRYLFSNGCGSVTEIRLPGTLKEIGPSAFAGCASLVRLEIPESVETLGADCFEGAKSLKELHIRADYGLPKYTSASPFRNSGIEKLVIEEGVTTIAASFFKDGCACMTELALPSTLETVGGAAFGNCTSLESITVRSNARVPAGTVLSPFEGGSLECIMFEEGVEAVGPHLFSGACTSLTQLCLPGTLKEIGASAFAGCRSLAGLEIPESVETLGAGCFEGAASLKELHIRADYGLPKYTSVSPFLGSGIEKLVIEEGVTTIAASFFKDGCACMTELVLPSTLETVGGAAFGNCTSLESVTVRSNAGVPAGTAVSPFEGGSLEGITFAEGVTEAGAYFFSGACTGLTSLTLPETLTTIGSCAFRGCSSLAELYIPPSVQEIGAGAFESCTSLTVLYMNSPFRKPAGVPGSPFQDGGITEVRVADGVAGMEALCLNNAGRTRISAYIPVSVTTVGPCVFDSGMEYIVYYAGTESQWGEVEKDPSFAPVQVICTGAENATDTEVTQDGETADPGQDEGGQPDDGTEEPGPGAVQPEEGSPEEPEPEGGDPEEPGAVQPEEGGMEEPEPEAGDPEELEPEGGVQEEPGAVQPEKGDPEEPEPEAGQPEGAGQENPATGLPENVETERPGSVTGQLEGGEEGPCQGADAVEASGNIFTDEGAPDPEKPNSGDI